jgi:hypothetical protein
VATAACGAAARRRGRERSGRNASRLPNRGAPLLRRPAALRPADALLQAVAESRRGSIPRWCALRGRAGVPRGRRPRAALADGPAPRLRGGFWDPAYGRLRHRRRSVWPPPTPDGVRATTTCTASPTFAHEAGQPVGGDTAMSRRGRVRGSCCCRQCDRSDQRHRRFLPALLPARCWRWPARLRGAGAQQRHAKSLRILGALEAGAGPRAGCTRPARRVFRTPCPAEMARARADTPTGVRDDALDGAGRCLLARARCACAGRARRGAMAWRGMSCWSEGGRSARRALMGRPSTGNMHAFSTTTSKRRSTAPQCLGRHRVMDHARRQRRLPVWPSAKLQLCEAGSRLASENARPVAREATATRL